MTQIEAVRNCDTHEWKVMGDRHTGYQLRCEKCGAVYHGSPEDEKGVEYSPCRAVAH